MLTKVTAYSQWDNVDPLVLNVIDRPETDLFEVRDIQGLGAVKADINTTPRGSSKGSSFVGSNVGDRNLVFTLGLSPNWDNWTVSRLRRLLDKFFMPEQFVRLVFESTEYAPVEISGWVESNDPNIFSKDPEQQISVICPTSDFVAVDPTIINGQTDMDFLEIEYEGNVKCGIHVEVSRISGTTPWNVAIETSADDLLAHQGFFVEADAAVVTETKKLVMNSLPGDKYIQTEIVVPDPGDITNLLNYLNPISEWQTLRPGSNTFAVITDSSGLQAWTLTYFALYGSL